MTTRRRTLMIALAILLTIAAVATTKAEPLCRRLVQEYREKRVKNRVSKNTAARWAEWNKTHPNFHPKPRPKYKTVPEEVVKQVEFACQVPQQPIIMRTMLTPGPLLELPAIKIDPPPPPVFPPPVLPTVTEIATAGTPPPPFLPPYSPGPPPGLSPIPEPSSIWLLASGAICILGISVYKQRRQGSATSF